MGVLCTTGYTESQVNELEEGIEKRLPYLIPAICRSGINLLIRTSPKKLARYFGRPIRYRDYRRASQQKN